MAVSKCGKCEATRFELKTQEPSGSAVKFNFIQCAACGTVVGVTDFLAVGTMVGGLSGDIGNMAKRVDDVLSRISRLEAILARR